MLLIFLIQQANVRASELKTAKEFNEEVKNVDGAVNKKISNIEVSAYASPDGGVSLNTKLAENRQDNTAKVINQNLKKAKVDAAIDTKYTAQDWEGFQELVSKSNIQDKELILRVLSMYSDPEQREQEIKNMMLASCFSLMIRWKASSPLAGVALLSVCSTISEVEITPSATFTAGIVTVLLPIVALNSRYISDLAISGT